MKPNAIIKHINTGSELVLAVFVDGLRVSPRYSASTLTCVEYAQSSGASLLTDLSAIALDDYRRGLWCGGFIH